MKETTASFELINSNPTQRDPRICPFGVFLTNAMSAGGGQSFYWFLHEADAVGYIMELAMEANPDEEFESHFAGKSTFSDLSLECIHAGQVSFTIRWAGRFEDLMESKARFACEIRNDFMEIYVSGIFKDTNQITKDRFVEHLGRYSERFPARTFVSGFRFGALKD